MNGPLIIRFQVFDLNKLQLRLDHQTLDFVEGNLSYDDATMINVLDLGNYSRIGDWMERQPPVIAMSTASAEEPSACGPRNNNDMLKHLNYLTSILFYPNQNFIAVLSCLTIKITLLFLMIGSR